MREEEHRAAWHKYKALMEVLNKVCSLPFSAIA